MRIFLFFLIPPWNNPRLLPSKSFKLKKYDSSNFSFNTKQAELVFEGRNDSVSKQAVNTMSFSEYSLYLCYTVNHTAPLGLQKG